MIDLASTVAPKSDQLNADDLIAGPRTVTVTGVRACPDSAEQPIDISFDGDNGKPYKPCKSMRRVLIAVWGNDGAAYAGRSMTLYCDPDVTFGGMKVGGIRISHMSHIDKPQTMALTATRAKRKPFTVRPLAAQAPGVDPAESQRLARAAATAGTNALRQWWRDNPNHREGANMILSELQAAAAAADDPLPPADDGPTPEEMRAAEESAMQEIAARDSGQ